MIKTKNFRIITTKKFFCSKPEYIQIKGNKYPWFPTNILELNNIGRVLSAGKELKADHPSFNDQEYRKRRSDIVAISNSHQISDGLKIPLIDYFKEENQLWSEIYDKLSNLHEKHASKEYLESFKIIEAKGVFSRNRIPQVKDVSRFLKNKSNVFIRPIGGLLSQRDFLYGLAFRVFHSTQYIRHANNSDYTPEPDIVHELIGHSPLFVSDKLFNIYHQIGLTALGLSDEEIDRLFAVYWYGLEFGVLLEKGEKKICGGAILSSSEEIKNVYSPQVKLLDFNLDLISQTPLIITNLQPSYFVASSYNEIVESITNYLKTFKKSFDVKYNEQTESIEII